MNCFKPRVAILAIALTGFAASALAATPQPNDVGYKLADSRQTFVLTPGSRLYTEWASWIKRQDADHKKADGTTWGAGEVGQITIVAVIPPASGSLIKANNAGSPSDNGPPVPLPTTGQQGQTLKIVNQTSTVYQLWIYQWSNYGGGGGGWSEISYSANSCSAGLETGKLCPNSQE